MSDLDKVKQYVGETKFVILATAGKDGVPVLRTLGSFVNDGLDIYFSTGKNTAKVEQILNQPNVTLLFQHEGQQLPAFVNVAITGEAKQVQCENGYKKAVNLLSGKSARFKERAEKGELEDTAIFKVTPKSLKVLDFSRGTGPLAVEEVDL